jgi:hypothetical protein
MVIRAYGYRVKGSWNFGEEAPRLVVVLVDLAGAAGLSGFLFSTILFDLVSFSLVLVSFPSKTARSMNTLSAKAVSVNLVHPLEVKKGRND